MSSTFEKVCSGGLTAAALTIAAAFAYRQLVPQRAVAASPGPAAPPSFERNWQSLLPIADVLGDTMAPVKIVEFADFECPYCRRADSVYRRASAKFGQQVALYYVHFPLTAHRFAIPAARAAECAKGSGKFNRIHDALFDKQDSLGLKSWTSFASDAGVSDTVAFATCIRGSAPVASVEAGLRAGRRMNVHATPTLFVNGWRFTVPPDEQELDSAITAQLALVSKE